MNFGLKIGLVLFAIFLTIMLICIIIYFYYLIKRNRRLKILNKLKSEVKGEILVKADRVIIQIKKIFENNSNYFLLLNKLTNIYDLIEASINEVNQQIEAVKQKYLSFSLKQFSLEVKMIKTSLVSFRKLSLEFSSLSHEFIDKDEYVRSEMVFLKNCLRDIIFQYHQNRAILNDITTKVDNIINELNEIAKDFDNALNKGEIRAASSFLDLYERRVYKLALIISEGPLIITHIFYNIPNRTKELINSFNTNKKMYPEKLKYIDLNATIEKLVELHRQSRTQYELLAFEPTKMLIKQCHEIISQIKHQINLEILASNFFIKNHSYIVFEIAKAMQRFISLKTNYFSILEGEALKILDLLDMFKELTTLNQTLSQQQIILKSLQNNSKMSFLNKTKVLKQSMVCVLKFVELENRIQKQIWLFNVENIILKNKFQKVESVVNELIINLKESNLTISFENHKILENISNQVASIGEIIYENKNIGNFKFKIDSLVEKVTNLYIAIGGDLQIAQITKNMIKELNIRRLFYKKLGYVLNDVEKDYMVGKYAEALNNIINFLDEKIYLGI